MNLHTTHPAAPSAKHSATPRRLATLMVAGVVLAGCGGSNNEPTGSPTNASTSESATSTTAGSTSEGTASTPGEITIENFSFSGATEVAAGTKLKVTNNDTTTHTFTADDGSFDSGNIEPGGTFEVTLDQPGTVSYHCSIHSSMKGSITVTG